jgi:hypothetical protein
MTVFVDFFSQDGSPIYVRRDAVVIAREALVSEVQKHPMTLLILMGGVRQFVVGEAHDVILQLETVNVAT